ncbi:hypothetical protein ABK040_002219 [Willaertia magna]
MFGSLTSWLEKINNIENKENKSILSIEEVLHSKDTYLNNDHPIIVFNDETNNFNIENKTDEITNLLNSDKILNDLHTELVPEQITYELFWKKYFLFKEQLEANEKKRKLFQSLQQERKDEIPLLLDESSNITKRELFYLQILQQILNSNEFQNVEEIKSFIKNQLNFKQVDHQSNTTNNNTTIVQKQEQQQQQEQESIEKEEKEEYDEWE